MGWKLECGCGYVLLEGTAVIAIFGLIRCNSCLVVNRVELNWPDFAVARVVVEEAL